MTPLQTPPSPPAWLKNLRLAQQLLLGLIQTPFYGSPFTEKGMRTVRRWHHGVCRALDVSVHSQGEAQRGVLYVCNHISWLDIPVLASQLGGVRFLSKSEVRGWPFIGWLATRAGTLFIQRGKGEDSIAAISHALSLGHNVLLFAEGTTTNGLSLRRFHPRLLQAAHSAKAHIQPIALRYVDAQGAPAPHVAYIDDDSFADTLQRIVRAPGVRAEVQFLPPIDPNSVPRRELAELAHAQVRAALPHLSGN